MIRGMADIPVPAWTRGERAGAVMLAILALGLLFIGADVISGGRLTRRKGCGCHDDQPGD